MNEESMKRLKLEQEIMERLNTRLKKFFTPFSGKTIYAKNLSNHRLAKDLLENVIQKEFFIYSFNDEEDIYLRYKGETWKFNAQIKKLIKDALINLGHTPTESRIDKIFKIMQYDIIITGERLNILKKYALEEGYKVKDLETGEVLKRTYKNAKFFYDLFRDHLIHNETITKKLDLLKGYIEDGQIQEDQDLKGYIDMDELWEIVMGFIPFGEGPKPVGWRRLNRMTITRIVEILRSYYTKGSRGQIVLYISGWLKNSKIEYEDSQEIIRLLAESDEEKEDRLKILERVYFSKMPEEAKGKTGLQEVLMDIMKDRGMTEKEAEELTLKILSNLQDLIGAPSPWGDSIIYTLDLDRGVYAVANYRTNKIYTAVKRKEGMVYKNLVATAVPTHVIVYYDPLNLSSIRYEIDFTDTTGRTRTYGPADMESIIKALSKNGLITYSRGAKDVISGIITKYRETGKAEIRDSAEAPGFYLMRDELIGTGLNLIDPDSRELREALEFLDELVSKIFPSPEKTAMVIKWGVVAPFSYVRKQVEEANYQPWLYLYGPSQSAKTTRGGIICHIWGVPTEIYIISASEINTEARLGHYLTRSTLPFIVREEENILNPEERGNLIEMIKSSIESLIARGKFQGDIYTQYPALAPLVFTSNKYKPEDPAILNRMVLISFFDNEILPIEKREIFNHTIRPKLDKLNPIGPMIWLYVKARFSRKGKEFFKMPWEKMAEEILEFLYQSVDLNPPEWIKYHYEEEKSPEVDFVEDFRGWVLDEINRAYRNVDITERNIDMERVQGIGDLEEYEKFLYDKLMEKVVKTFAGYYIPWGGFKEIDGKEYIVIYTSILNRLPKHLKDPIQKSFKHLIAKLEYEGLAVEERRIWDQKNKKTRIGAYIPLSEFLYFLKGGGEKRQRKIEHWEVIP